jgi:predicted ATPase
MSKLFASLAEADLDSGTSSSSSSSSFCSSSVSTELGGGYDNAIVSNRRISLWGRTITVPESSNTVARFKFADLCDRPLSAADYLEITNRFPTIFVEGVPNMGLSERDQARRFITFIDGEFLLCQAVNLDQGEAAAGSAVKRIMDEYAGKLARLW